MHSFADEMVGFIHLFNICGLSPFSRKPNTNLALVLYSLICTLGSCINITTAIVQKKVVLESSVGHLASGIYFFSLNATHVIISLETIVCRKEQQLLFQLFSDVDDIFRKRLNWTISYRNERRHKWKILLTILAVFFLIRGYFTVILVKQDLINAYWYQCLYAILVNRISTVRNIFYVLSLINRLKYLSENFEQILTTTAFGQTYEMPSKNLGRDTVCRSLLFSIEPSEKGPDYHKILALKDIYGKLYSICDVINSTFGWSFLAIFTHEFIDFTLDGYWVFVAIKQKQSNQTSVVINFIGLLFPVLFQLFIIAFYCRSATKNVSKYYISYKKLVVDGVGNTKGHQLAHFHCQNMLNGNSCICSS